MPIYPISFSIPEENIINDIQKKIKFQSNLIPGDLSTYIYDSKESYNKEYQNSLFAFTYKKGGWDCTRHYEILANGCIPYFPTINECSKNTMFLLPRDLIMEGNILYEKINDKINKKNVNIINKKFYLEMKKKWKIKDEHNYIFENVYKNVNINTNELDASDIEKCKILIKKLINYTKINLTTKALSSYILNTTKNLNITSILYLGNNGEPDYLHNLILHGFKKLLGEKCYDYPRTNCMYQSGNVKTRTTILFTIQNILNDDEYEKIDNIEDNIKNKKYSLIIYGSYTRATPYYDLVNKYYNSNSIILLDGDDVSKNINKNFKNNNIFIRELI